MMPFISQDARTVPTAEVADDAPQEGRRQRTLSAHGGSPVRSRSPALGPKAPLIIQGHFDASRQPISTISGDIEVWPGAVVHGPQDGVAIGTVHGNIMIRGASVLGHVHSAKGRIVISHGSDVRGDVSQDEAEPGGRAPGEIRVDASRIRGTVTGHHITVQDGQVQTVRLLPQQDDQPERQGRVELAGEARVGEVVADGHGLVVRRAALPQAPLLQGGGLRVCDLHAPPVSLPWLQGLPLPVAVAPNDWSAWHRLQQVLECLCDPVTGQFRHLADPKDWLPWVSALVTHGKAVSQLFGHLLRAQPAMLLEGVRAQSPEGVKRSCAALCLALLHRGQVPPSAGERKLLEAVAERARELEVRSQGIDACIDRLEGCGSGGSPLMMQVGEGAWSPKALSRQPPQRLPEVYLGFRRALKPGTPRDEAA